MWVRLANESREVGHRGRSYREKAQLHVCVCVRVFLRQWCVVVCLLELLPQTEPKEADGHHWGHTCQRGPHTFIEAKDTLKMCMHTPTRTHTHTHT